MALAISCLVYSIGTKSARQTETSSMAKVIYIRSNNIFQFMSVMYIPGVTQVCPKLDEL